MNKNEQLRWVTQIFQENNCPFWIRAGTLLGLVREKTILPWDDDLDIGIWRDDIETIEPVLEELKANDFSVIRNYYKNKCLGFDIRPLNQKYPLKIEISVFSKSNKWAWAPAKKLKDTNKSTTSSQKKMGYTTKVARFFWQFGKNTLLPNDISVTVTKFPANYFYQLGTWAVPLHFYENTELINIGSISLPAPKNYKGYLSYRYGNWKKPKKTWDYWNDDQSLIKKEPCNFIN